MESTYRVDAGVECIRLVVLDADGNGAAVIAAH